MVTAQPHFLLFCDTHSNSPASSDTLVTKVAMNGRWHFVLEQLDGPHRLEAADCETRVNRERLALLSVVRGLEALEQPSKVTLVTTSKYVSRGLRYGLSTWRESDYKWERFGVQMPVRNADLWQRIDGALRFHGVTCRLIHPEQSSAQTMDHTRLNSPLTPAAARAIVSEQPQSLNVSPSQNPRVYGLFPHQLWRELWWNLASHWIRWWRGRMPLSPVFHGS